MISKEIDLSAPIHELLKERWSGVTYDPSRPVSDKDIRSIAEAARWAPSCFGDEPWRFIICNKLTHPKAWNKAFDCLAEGNKTWCQHVPVLIIACHDTRLQQNDKPNGWAQYDTGAASISLCLQATQLGLMSHQMAGFSAPAAEKSFKLPERFKAISLVAIGYQLSAENIPAHLKERELKPRRRKPLSKHFFSGDWGNGI